MQQEVGNEAETTETMWPRNSSPYSTALLTVTGWTDSRGLLRFQRYYVQTECPSQRVTATLHLQSYGIGGIAVTPTHLCSIGPATEPNGNHFLLRGTVVRQSSAGALALEVYDDFKRRTLVNCLATRAVSLTPIESPFAEVRGSLIDSRLTAEHIMPLPHLENAGWERSKVLAHRRKRKTRARRNKQRDVQRQAHKADIQAQKRKQRRVQQNLPPPSPPKRVTFKLGKWQLTVSWDVRPRSRKATSK